MVFPLNRRIKGFKTRCKDYCTNIYCNSSGRLVKINGVVLTYVFTDTALLFLQVQAALIYISDKRYSLGKIYMDSLVI